MKVKKKPTKVPKMIANSKASKLKAKAKARVSKRHLMHEVKM